MIISLRESFVSEEMIWNIVVHIRGKATSYYFPFLIRLRLTSIYTLSYIRLTKISVQSSPWNVYPNDDWHALKSFDTEDNAVNGDRT